MHILSRRHLMNTTYRAGPYLFTGRRFVYLDIDLSNVTQFDIERLHANKRVYLLLVRIKIDVIVG